LVQPENNDLLNLKRSMVILNGRWTETVKSEIISYDKRARGRTRTFEELRYIVKWRGSSEDEKTRGITWALRTSTGIGRRFS